MTVPLANPGQSAHLAQNKQLSRNREGRPGRGGLHNATKGSPQRRALRVRLCWACFRPVCCDLPLPLHSTSSTSGTGWCGRSQGACGSRAVAAAPLQGAQDVHALHVLQVPAERSAPTRRHPSPAARPRPRPSPGASAEAARGGSPARARCRENRAGGGAPAPPSRASVAPFRPPAVQPDEVLGEERDVLVALAQRRIVNSTTRSR